MWRRGRNRVLIVHIIRSFLTLSVFSFYVSLNDIASVELVRIAKEEKHANAPATSS